MAKTKVIGAYASGTPVETCGVYAGVQDGVFKNMLTVSPQDMAWLAKKAGLFVHDKDDNDIATIGGPKKCHNPKCRCRKKS